jgi:hypothetical protein
MRVVRAGRTKSRMMERRGAIVFAVVIAAFVSLAGMAQTKDPPWIAKDWTTWTASDCTEVLNNSQWVKDDQNSYAEYSPYLDRKIKVLSALPMRQALLRLIQLEKHYDSMNAQKKQEFDQLHAGDLADGNILIDISNSSGWHQPFDNTGSYIDSQADPPRQIALQVSNKLPSYDSLLMPIQTRILKSGQFENETQYEYPRIVNGKSLITSSDWFLYVLLGGGLEVDTKTKQVVQEPFEQSMGTYSIRDPKSGKIVKNGNFHFSSPFTFFKVSDLMYKGKLEY